MRLGKLATQKLRDGAKSALGRVHCDFGLDRGRGGTGKLRQYGERDRQAFRALVRAGFVEQIGQPSTSTFTRRGYQSQQTVVTGVVTPAGRDYASTLTA